MAKRRKAPADTGASKRCKLNAEVTGACTSADPQVVGEKANPRQPCSINTFVIAAALGLSVFSYGRLLAVGFPTIVFEIMKTVVAMRQPTPRLCGLEAFCGVATIATEFIQAGFPFHGADILLDPDNHDLTTPAGFVYLLFMVLSFEADAILWFATVCSSWIWLSRSSTGRNKRMPLGTPHLCRSVEDGNTMVARSAVLMMLCAARHGWWALEQPAGSLMARHPSLLYLHSIANMFPWLGWQNVTTSMAAFQAECSKPTNLYANNRFIKALRRSKPKMFMPTNKDLVTFSHKADGTRQVTGSHGLKKTQTYTRDFAQSVLESYVTFRGNFAEDVDTEDLTLQEDGAIWETARFDECVRYLEET